MREKKPKTPINRNIIKRDINLVLEMDLNNEIKQGMLNELESFYKQEIFIKTNVCNDCNNLNVELWFREGLEYG